MKEIEHKFLVDIDKWKELEKPEPELIVQGFLHKSKEITVRVRIKGRKGFLTIKGKTEGVSRHEFDYEIPLNEAEAMIELFIDKYIRKHRYEIPVGNHTWEVDEFHGKLEGLTLAEVELSSENEQFEKPEWATKDVSTNPQYFNAVLIDRC